MLIQCPQCETTFKLDEKLLPPGGSLVRCSRCGHVFRAEPPQEEHPVSAPSDHEEEEKTEPAETIEPESEPRLLAEEEEILAVLPGPPQKRWWSRLGMIVLLVLLALTVRYSYLQIMNPGQGFLEVLKEVFFLPADPEGNKKVRLSEVKGYFKNHQTEGRFFVVEGKVTNGYNDPRNRIRLRGTLQDHTRRAVAKREVTAGWTLKAEELETQPLADISRLQESQAGPLTAGTSLLPGGSAPFMIIFPPVTQTLSEFSVEVLGSKKIAPATPPVR